MTADPIGGRPWTPVPLARGTHGAVVAPHHLATAAGLGILRAGGSAVDAAIATNAVLAVVMPASCGIGGDAFWLIWDDAAGRQHALNGSGRAPAAADAAALLASGLRVLPRRGPLTITVPGAVRSWGDAHARHGRLSRDAILGPAIELARRGVPGMGRVHRRCRADRAARPRGHRSGRRVLRGLSAARARLATGRARTPARPGPHAGAPRDRRLRRVLRGRPGANARRAGLARPGRRSTRTTCASTPPRGARPSASTTAAPA